MDHVIISGIPFKDRHLTIDNCSLYYYTKYGIVNEKDLKDKQLDNDVMFNLCKFQKMKKSFYKNNMSFMNIFCIDIFKIFF